MHIYTHASSLPCWIDNPNCCTINSIYLRNFRSFPVAVHSGEGSIHVDGIRRRKFRYARSCETLGTRRNYVFTGRDANPAAAMQIRAVISQRVKYLSRL